MFRTKPELRAVGVAVAIAAPTLLLVVLRGPEARASISDTPWFVLGMLFSGVTLAVHRRVEPIAPVGAIRPVERRYTSDLSDPCMQCGSLGRTTHEEDGHTFEVCDRCGQRMTE